MILRPGTYSPAELHDALQAFEARVRAASDPQPALIEGLLTMLPTFAAETARLAYRTGYGSGYARGLAEGQRAAAKAAKRARRG